MDVVQKRGLIEDDNILIHTRCRKALLSKYEYLSALSCRLSIVIGFGILDIYKKPSTNAPVISICSDLLIMIS